MASAPFRDRNTSLDILRFGAALLVLFEHTRAAIFIPYEAVEQNRLLLAPFYALTSMGHALVLGLVVAACLPLIGMQTWSSNSLR